MTKPMYRADHVGSLLRPAAVAAARNAGQTGADLTAVEDAEIPGLIALQEEAGMKVVTDGEARRAFWHYDYMDLLNGLDIIETGSDALGFKGATITKVPQISGPLSFPKDHPMLEHFRFVAANTNVTPKISIPGPSAVHFRLTPDRILHAPYKDTELFMADIAACYRDAVAAFYDAGCRYLQLDDIFFAYLADEKQRQIRRDMGEDPDWLIDRYAWMLEEAIKDRPADMTAAMHMCRGNFKSTFVATGGYDVAADAIFNKTSIDVYFMEYDTDRAGGLEPLSLLPKGTKRVLPGFITTKTPELEDMDMLKRRFEEASKYVSMDQLGIAPQCGFASTEEGNAITEDDQRRKLELVVRLSEELWDDA